MNKDLKMQQAIETHQVLTAEETHQLTLTQRVANIPRLHQQRNQEGINNQSHLQLASSVALEKKSSEILKN